MQYLIQRVPDALRKILEASGACCKRMYCLCVLECVNRCSSSTWMQYSFESASDILHEMVGHSFKDCTISFKGIDEPVLP